MKDPVAGVGVIIQLVLFIDALGPIENELATAGVRQLDVAGVMVIALVKVRRIWYTNSDGSPQLLVAVNTRVPELLPMLVTTACVEVDTTSQVVLGALQL